MFDHHQETILGIMEMRIVILVSVSLVAFITL